MDRKAPQLARLQESFINHLVAPLCKACAEAGILPGFWEPDEEADEDDHDYEGDDDEAEEPGSVVDIDEERELEIAPDDISSNCQDENDESSRSDDNHLPKKNLKRKIFCLQTAHLQDNHNYWMNVLKVG